MDVNIYRSSFCLSLVIIGLFGLSFYNVHAQSDFPGLSNNLFGGSSSTSDNSQFTNVTPNQTSGLSKFTNTEYGFEFEFPSNWEVLNPSSVGLSMEGIPIQVASIRSPAEGIRDLLTISVLEPTRYLDTDTMEVKMSILSAQEHAKIVTDLFLEYGFKVVRENPVTVADLPAYRIEYTTYNYKTEVFVVKPDGTLYKLEFGTPMLRAPESLPVFNKMVESFKFVNSSNILNNPQIDSSNQSSSNISANSSPPSSLDLPNSDTSSLSGNSLQPFSQIQQFNTDNDGLTSSKNSESLNNAGSLLNSDIGVQEKIILKLNSAEFQTTESSDHQAKILVDYETIDPSLEGERINGILEISESDGSQIKTTSYEDGFRITESGIIQFASTIDDEDIDTVVLNVHLTDVNKIGQISNSINATVSLDDEEVNAENNNEESDEEDN